MVGLGVGRAGDLHLISTLYAVYDAFLMLILKRKAILFEMLLLAAYHALKCNLHLSHSICRTQFCL